MTESSSPTTPGEWAAAFVEKFSDQDLDVEMVSSWFEDAMKQAHGKGFELGVAHNEELRAESSREVQPKPLALYQYGDRVEVYHQGQWVPGRVHSNDPATRLLIVDTESGPRTLNSTRAIRPAQA